MPHSKRPNPPIALRRHLLAPLGIAARQSQREHAVLHLGLGVLHVDGVWQPEGALEAAPAVRT